MNKQCLLAENKFTFNGMTTEEVDQCRLSVQLCCTDDNWSMSVVKTNITDNRCTLEWLCDHFGQIRRVMNNHNSPICINSFDNQTFIYGKNGQDLWTCRSVFGRDCSYTYERVASDLPEYDVEKCSYDDLSPHQPMDCHSCQRGIELARKYGICDSEVDGLTVFESEYQIEMTRLDKLKYECCLQSLPDDHLCLISNYRRIKTDHCPFEYFCVKSGQLAAKTNNYNSTICLKFERNQLNATGWSQSQVDYCRLVHSSSCIETIEKESTDSLEFAIENGHCDNDQLTVRSVCESCLAGITDANNGGKCEPEVDYPIVESKYYHACCDLQIEGINGRTSTEQMVCGKKRSKPLINEQLNRITCR